MSGTHRYTELWLGHLKFSMLNHRITLQKLARLRVMLRSRRGGIRWTSARLELGRTARPDLGIAPASARAQSGESSRFSKTRSAAARNPHRRPCVLTHSRFRGCIPFHETLAFWRRGRHGGRPGAGRRLGDVAHGKQSAGVGAACAARGTSHRASVGNQDRAAARRLEPEG